MSKAKVLLCDIKEYCLSLFFPNRCIFCNEVIGPYDNMCTSCEDKLPWIRGELCEYCGSKKEDCDCKKRHSNFYDGIAAPLYYVGDVRKSIHNFKFKDDKNAYKVFAELMNDTRREVYNDIEFDYITYTPMSKRHRRKRGYNQSELLAERISELSGITFAEDMIQKIYPTRIQHKCVHWTERKGNLLGAFDVNQKYNVEGKNILLIDDVKTSGATLSECGKMLFLYGAENVYCLTAAIVNSKIKEQYKKGG